ncbi:GAF domain-containing protein, partial [Mycobacterium avium]|uniref:GAF domain-containing protein n=1 Tax=Mycobacterium avium TaxID=1764 RepID=UPI0005B2EFB2
MDSDRDDSAANRRDRRELDRMHTQLDELMAARDQLEQLVRVIVEIGSDLDLDVTLRRVLKAAMELTGARYAVLSSRASDGGLLSFVHAGLDADTARQLGELAVGDGLRIDDVSVDPRSAHLSAHDPPLRALLGIPITVRAANFGNLYLADDRQGRVFTDSQEGAVRAMATAGAPP